MFAFSFYILRIFVLMHPLASTACLGCIQASPALRGGQGISAGGPKGRLAASTEKRPVE